ncbi:MAG TPA: hypothetical protein ENJ95_12795 [Bacteroidetes bacterium]|nr:hypothetical protein [Bacteroidota bacterium]
MRYKLLLFYSLSFFWSFGQEPAYMHYTVQDGLPSSTVYCIEEDSKGFLWFGTDNGLARFDGNRFKVYGVEDGLPDPEVFNIYEDSKGRLWLSCFRKKPCYFEKGKIITAESDSLLNKIETENGIYSFFEDSNGNVWISGDTKKICRWADASVFCMDMPKIDKPHKKQRQCSIKKMFEINSILYGLTPDVIYSIIDDTITNVLKLSDVYEYHRGASADFYVNNDKILLSTPRGTVILKHDKTGFYEFARNIFKAPFKNNVTTYIDKEGHNWINPIGYGATVYNNKQDKFINSKRYLSGEKISNIFEDKQGTYWFSMLNKGAIALPKNAPIIFSSHHGTVFKSNNITAVSRSRNDKIMVGDDSGTLYIKNNLNWKILNLDNSTGYNRILKFAYIQGDDWLAITDLGVFSKNGLVKYELDQGKETSRPITIKAAKTILTGTGSSFLGTFDVLLKWENDPKNSTVLLNKRTTALCKDLQNNVWVGNLEGVFSEKDNFVKNWGVKFPLLASRIIAIENADTNSIWIVSANSGLLLADINNGEILTVKSINSRLAKPIKNIRSIYVESNKRIWLATNKGIYSLTDKYEVEHFDKRDGLPSNDINAIFVNADTLWAATTEGLARVLLNQEKETGNFPTYISGINYTRENKTISHDLIYKSKKISVPPDASLLEVELSGLHYKSRGNIKYEYITKEQLLPPQWLTWGNIGNSIFSKCDTAIIAGHTRNYGVNSPPGTFNIQATAILKDGTRSTMPDECTITILPHWYNTVWFSLIALFITGYIGWLFYRETTKRRRMERTASDLQLQAIKAQINPHFVGNSINAIQQFFYPPDPAKASEYISIFSSLLRRTMYFSSVPFIPFREESAYIKDYLKMIKLRFDDRFEYKINGLESISDNTLFPAMLLQPILENATIHGLSPEGGSTLTVDFSIKNQKLYCTVTDNGVGISISKKRKKEKGISRISRGIDLLKNKIKLLNDMHGLDFKLTIEDLSSSDKNKNGTKATLSYSLYKIKNSTEI